MSGLAGLRKPGQGQCLCRDGVQGLRGVGRAAGSSRGTYDLGTGGLRGPQLLELQVNVTVLHPMVKLSTGESFM